MARNGAAAAAVGASALGARQCDRSVLWAVGLDSASGPRGAKAAALQRARRGRGGQGHRRAHAAVADRARGRGPRGRGGLRAQRDDHLAARELAAVAAAEPARVAAAADRARQAAADAAAGDIPLHRCLQHFV